MSRTPPGVRELKHSESSKESRKPIRRTPPGVRELKLELSVGLIQPKDVAPLPGCVN